MLYYNPIYCEEKDSEQAAKYQCVVFLRFAWDINAGCDFDKKLGKFVDVQKIEKKKPKQTHEPVMTKEQKKLLNIKLMNKRLDEERGLKQFKQ